MTAHNVARHTPYTCSTHTHAQLTHMQHAEPTGAVVRIALTSQLCFALGESRHQAAAQQLRPLPKPGLS